MEMQKGRKVYARYYIVRGHLAMWKGDPAKEGSKYRGFAIASNEFFSTGGTFQVYGLEATSAGIRDGELVISDDAPTVLFDKDFQGLDAAGKKFDELIKESEGQGFKGCTLMDEMEFQAKLKGN
jgi:hypothetical protein